MRSSTPAAHHGPPGLPGRREYLRLSFPCFAERGSEHRVHPRQHEGTHHGTHPYNGDRRRKAQAPGQDAS
ncbi:protein of unknown function [Cupriavidus neocaledonicus]|uniref:Uncharacterized protein n=1 Tax=Cupriavidus neocaledonicus TaxID=1040979 RepID=A0A375H962_9BURK|nr:protein of unknown function [Cupriavidus neocaledonicus]